MKRLGLLCLLVLSTVVPSRAMDIADKWGIGAGIVGSSSEIALMRGHSARTVWALDAEFKQDAAKGIPSGFIGGDSRNQHELTTTLGPHYRHFIRPTERLTPYYDVRLDATYERFDDSDASFSTAEWRAGLESGIGIGAEYFTPWSFSLALDSDLVSGGFERGHSWNGGPPILVVPSSVWSTEWFSHIGVAPRLLVRAYF